LRITIYLFDYSVFIIKYFNSHRAYTVLKKMVIYSLNQKIKLLKFLTYCLKKVILNKNKKSEKN